MGLPKNAPGCLALWTNPPQEFISTQNLSITDFIRETLAFTAPRHGDLPLLVPFAFKNSYCDWRHSLGTIN